MYLFRSTRKRYIDSVRLPSALSQQSASGRRCFPATNNICVYNLTGGTMCWNGRPHAIHISLRGTASSRRRYFDTLQITTVSEAPQPGHMWGNGVKVKRGMRLSSKCEVIREWKSLFTHCVNRTRNENTVFPKFTWEKQKKNHPRHVMSVSCFACKYFDSGEIAVQRFLSLQMINKYEFVKYENDEVHRNEKEAIFSAEKGGKRMSKRQWKLRCEPASLLA